jgi:transcription initiation factor TFIID TATA-box-binding protein
VNPTIIPCKLIFLSLKVESNFCVYPIQGTTKKKKNLQSLPRIRKSKMPKRRYSKLLLAVPFDVDCPNPTVHNIVSTAFIHCTPIDLTALSLILPYSFYDRQRFAAITIRLRSPCCTTLLFSSGKLVVTGGRDWYECVLAGLIVTRILRDVFPTKQFILSDCEIQNIVAHVELPMGEKGILDLQSMYGKLGLNCMYQKTMFPGLVFRANNSPVVLLCFYSGKIVITGGKTTQDVTDGWRKLWPTVRVFVRDKV